MPPFRGVARKSHIFFLFFFLCFLFFCSNAWLTAFISVPLPRVAPDTAPNVFSVTRGRCPRSAGATNIFAALPTYKASLPPLPRATPILPQASLPSRSCAAPAPAQRARRPFLQPFQRTGRLCPRCPAPPRYYPTRLPRHAGTLHPRRGRNLHVHSPSAGTHANRQPKV